MSHPFGSDSTGSLESSNQLLPFTGQEQEDILSQQFIGTGGLEYPNSGGLPLTSTEDQFLLGQSVETQPVSANNSDADILAGEKREASSWWSDARNGIQNATQNVVDYFTPDPITAYAPGPPVNDINQVYQEYSLKLGSPTSGVIDYNGYEYQLFDDGSIVKSDRGAYPLYGEIRKKYLETDGGLEGYLGAPSSAEYDWNGIIRQDFEGGYITWDYNGATVYGYENSFFTPEPQTNDINQVYQEYSWKLGSPTSGVIDYNGYEYQLFDDGSIVKSDRGAYPLYGEIRKKYLETDGGLEGYLGAPSSPEYDWNGIIRQDFEGGYITWDYNGATVYGNSSQAPSYSYQAPSSGVSSEAQRILNAVEQVNPDQSYYLPHDITGDGINETFCNWFAADVLEVLGVPIARHSQAMYPPVFGGEYREKPRSASQLYDFFNRGGYGGEWRAVNPSDAAALANNGEVVVASSPTPVPGNSGHIAIVLPNSSESDIRVAQAGRINGKNLSVSEGFGSSINSTSFFAYVG